MIEPNVVLALNLAAAKAAKLASDYAQNKLWPGDLSAGIREIESALDDARKGTAVDKAQYKTVPVDPTPEMLKAGRELFGDLVADEDSDYTRIYAAMIAAAPQPSSASGERAYPAVTYVKAFQFLGSLANPLFDTRFVGDDANSSEIPNAGLVRLVQAMIDEDRAALAPSPGIDAAEQKPIRLQHLAVVDEDGLRWMSGRKKPDGVESIELYAMPDYGRAPDALFAAPPAAQRSAEWIAEAERLLRESERTLVQAALRGKEPEWSISRACRAALLAHLKARP